MQKVKRQPFFASDAPQTAAAPAPATPATTHAPAQSYAQDDLYTRLANLMDWKQRGWLTDVEFEAPKAQLVVTPGP